MKSPNTIFLHREHDGLFTWCDERIDNEDIEYAIVSNNRKDELIIEPHLFRYYRIKDLPFEERTPFHFWLIDRDRPVIPGIETQDQDAYYYADYQEWKEGQIDNLEKL